MCCHLAILYIKVGGLIWCSTPFLTMSEALLYLYLESDHRVHGPFNWMLMHHTQRRKHCKEMTEDLS